MARRSGLVVRVRHYPHATQAFGLRAVGFHSSQGRWPWHAFGVTLYALAVHGSTLGARGESAALSPRHAGLRPTRRGVSFKSRPLALARLRRYSLRTRGSWLDARGSLGPTEFTEFFCLVMWRGEGVASGDGGGHGAPSKPPRSRKNGVTRFRLKGVGYRAKSCLSTSWERMAPSALWCSR